MIRFVCWYVFFCAASNSLEILPSGIVGDSNPPGYPVVRLHVQEKGAGVLRDVAALAQHGRQEERLMQLNTLRGDLHAAFVDAASVLAHGIATATSNVAENW